MTIVTMEELMAVEVKENINDYTLTDICHINGKASVAAAKAAREYFENEMGGEDRWSCGFAWVNIYDIKGNTKLGRNMKKAGFRKDYTGSFSVWNPSGIAAQNIDVKEVGAEAYAKVFKEYGFKAYAGSRLD